MILHYSITVSGKVQGVGFRYTAVRIARQLELTGFVKNNADGSVSLEAEGTEEKLEEFLQWCHTGPSRARVGNVKVTQGTLQHYPLFTIR